MIRLSTIIKFLCFDTEAIIRIAASRQSILVGFLFVLSAGFAREYDGEYLVAEPWHVLLPVLASLIGCFVMVLLLFVIAWFRKLRGAGFINFFMSFLSVYWMTAPLAWLYALPFERFLTPAGATRANLTLLAIVAVWRVALMVKCVRVMLGTSWIAAIMTVFLFSDFLMLVALLYIPSPVFMLMGGVRLTESESVFLIVRLVLILIGYGTFIIWLIGSFALVFPKSSWTWNVPSAADYSVGHPRQISVGVWGLTIIALAIWLPIMYFTQQEQALRYQVESAIYDDDLVELSRLTREHPESSFPPHWDPPPRIGYGEWKPEPHHVLAGLQANNGGKWLQDRFAEKIRSRAGSSYGHFEAPHLERMSDTELREYVDVVLGLENGKEIARTHRMFLESQLPSESDAENDVENGETETSSDGIQDHAETPHSDVVSPEDNHTESRRDQYRRLLDFANLPAENETFE